jgi:photosystem II stability/assembly factor-like uncharacterized protein
MQRLISAILTCTAALAADGWISVGPFGGGAEIIRVSASRPDILLAATRAGMIFQSVDRGAHWQIASQPPSNGCRIHALAIDPLHDNIWYTGFECELAAFSGLYRTRDAGATWDSMPDLRGDVVWSIAFSKTCDKIAVGMADGVFLSLDQEHFSRISPLEKNDLKPVVSLNFDRQDGRILYAGTTHLPWKTPDLGKTWQSIHGGMHDDSDVFSVEPDWRSATRVFASACSGAYLSDNQGTSWTRLPTPPGAFRAYFVAVDPHNPGTLFVATSLGLYRSTNSGRAWEKLSSETIKSYAFDPTRSGVVYFASPAAGIFSSQDGGRTLRRTVDGFANQNFCGLAASNGNIYVGVREAAGCRLLDRSPTGDWKTIATPEPIKALSASGKWLYVASGSRLLRSSNSGQTWMDLPKPAAAVAALEAAPNGSAVFAASRAGVFRLDPKSPSWRPAMSSEPKPASPRSEPRPLGSGPPSGPDIIATSPEGAVTSIAGGSAFFSLNEGSSWTACQPAEPDLVWYGLAMHRAPQAIGFAATSRGLFRVTDDCKTWTPIDGGLSLGTVSLIYPHPTNPDVFVASQGGRIYLSLDCGANWRPLSDTGRYGSFPAALAIDPAMPARVYALFPGLGVSYQDFGEAHAEAN